MSRAFVKEDASADAKLVLPDKPISTQPNYVTARGLGQLRAAHRDAEAELYALANDDSGDAKQKKAQLERDLRYLKARLESVIAVDAEAGASDVVRFGATVTVRDEDDIERVLSIVGEDEADIAQGFVSWVSPLARALQGAHVGDCVIWKRPAGEMELEVLRIEYL